MESSGNITHAGLITTSDDSPELGGVSVHPNGWLHLYGSFTKYFKLSNSIDINKFTQMKIQVHKEPFSEERNLDSKLIICLYEDIGKGIKEDCPSRCKEVEISIDQTLIPTDMLKERTLFLGDMFNSRKTNVNYIVLRQSYPSSRQSMLSLEYTRIEEIRFIDTDVHYITGNRCLDNNARLLTVQQSKIQTCQCLDGFVASNGGKIQGVYDTCISCLDRPSCDVDSSALGLGKSDVCANVSDGQSNFSFLLSTQLILLALTVIYLYQYLRINIQSGVSSLWSNATLVHTQSSSLRTDLSDSGTHVHPRNAGLSLYGNVVNTFHVPNMYIITELSRLTLSLTRANRADFIGFCLGYLGGDRRTLDKTRGTFCINYSAMNQGKELTEEHLPLSLQYNLALGKKVTYSTLLDRDNTDYAGNPSYAVDGNLDRSFYIDGKKSGIYLAETIEEFRFQCNDPAKCEDIEYELWWEVDLEIEYTVRTIIIKSDSIEGIYKVVLYDLEGGIAFQVDKVEKEEIEIPSIPCSRVRLLFQTKRTEVKEVIVLEEETGPRLHVDMPLWEIFPPSLDYSFDCIQFYQNIQQNSSLASPYLSYISDIKFLYASGAAS